MTICHKKFETKVHDRSHLLVLIQTRATIGLGAGRVGGGGGFDCRVLPNPFWVDGLRNYTGRDQPIVNFFAVHADAVAAFLKSVEELVRNTIAAYAQDSRERLSVGFGCTGGRHRSVYCAKTLAGALRGCDGVTVELTHTALPTVR